MNSLIALLTKTRPFKEDLDYHLVRTSMVIIYFFFGYLLAVSVYLLKQDLLRVTLARESARHEKHEYRASAASLVQSMQANRIQ